MSIVCESLIKSSMGDFSYLDLDSLDSLRPLGVREDYHPKCYKFTQTVWECIYTYILTDLICILCKNQVMNFKLL